MFNTTWRLVTLFCKESQQSDKSGLAIKSDCSKKIKTTKTECEAEHAMGVEGGHDEKCHMHPELAQAMCEASAREANQQRLQAKYKRMSERQLSQSYPFFKFFDVDGDGEVTSDEWITSFFQFYDVNQDYRMGLQDMRYFFKVNGEMICEDLYASEQEVAETR